MIPTPSELIAELSSWALTLDCLPDSDVSPHDQRTTQLLRNAARALVLAEAVTAERDAAYAMIEQAPHRPGCNAGWNEPCNCWKSKPPADVLAARDARVAGGAIRTLRDDDGFFARGRADQSDDYERGLNEAADELFALMDEAADLIEREAQR